MEATVFKVELNGPCQSSDVSPGENVRPQGEEVSGAEHKRKFSEEDRESPAATRPHATAKTKQNSTRLVRRLLACRHVLWSRRFILEESSGFPMVAVLQAYSFFHFQLQVTSHFCF